MTATTATSPAEIAAFAAAVRAHLDDLPVDEVDDLLDGLEADLSEQAADGDFAVPDAAAYAAELRAAAGLPERAEGPAPRVPLRERAERMRLAAAARIRRSAVGAASLDLLVSLRPVWWIVRGVALYVVIVGIMTFFSPSKPADALLPRNPILWIVLFASILLSVQWGRGLWLPTRWLRVVRTGVNAVTTVVAVIMLIAAPTVLPQMFSAQSAIAYEYVDNSQPGLVLDGQRVRNVFAYDADGQPLTGVQLFTEQGEPLSTVGREGLINRWQWDEYFLYGGGPVPGPYEGTANAPVWNVYPLREADDVIPGEENEPTLSRDARAPFAQVPAVSVDAAPTPSPSPTTTPEGVELEATTP